MGKKTLLFVDDEPINLLAFKAQFRREYNVFCTTDAEEALIILGTTDVACVFSDQRMPHSTGIEILTQVEQLYPAVRRAVISGFVDDEAIQQGLKQGTVEAAFEKPYRIDELIDFVETNAEEN